MVKYFVILGLLSMSVVLHGNATSIADTYNIQVILKDKSVTYTYTVIPDVAAKVASYKARIIPFVETTQMGQIGSVTVDSIRVDSPFIRSFQINFKAIPYTGYFVGKIILTGSRDNVMDTIVVPIRVHVISDEDLTVGKAEPATLNSVNGKILSCILPGEYNQKTIRIGLLNKSLYASTIDTCILSLLGKHTKNSVSTSDYTIVKSSLEGQMPGEILLRLDGKLPADEYMGTLYIKKQPGLTVAEVPISINVRDGVLLPLVVMILGVIFGFMAKRVEGAKELIELRQKIMGFESTVAKYHEITGKDELLSKLKETRSTIQTTVPGGDISSITAKFGLLEKQTQNATLLQENFLIIEKRIVDEAIKEQALGKLRKIAGTNLDRQELFAAAYTEFTIYLNDILSNGRESYVPPQEGQHVKPPAIEKESWLSKVYSVLANFLNINIIYGVFQPIIYIITVFLAIMAGFYEGYITKELAFGVGGIFDYIKLFIYGAGIVIVVNEVFTTMLPGLQRKFGAGNAG